MSVLLGLRLAVAGGRAAWARLALTTIGVGIGVTLLLLSLTVQSAVQGRADRSAWQHTTAQTPASAPDPALSLIVTDYYAGEPMMRVYVAALGPRPPVPPGLDRLPAPGEVAVSPAMRRLLASTPDDQLDDRFPGRVAATIGPSGLSHPDQLVAVVGHTPEQMRQISGAQQVRGIETVPTDYAFTAILRVFAAALTVLLLVPVVVFIVMVTRIAAVRREQRLAAIRLVGATRLQTALAAAAETLPAAALGTALGWIGYQAGRRLMASGVSWEVARFFAEDIVVPPDLLLLVLGGVPVFIMLVTVASLYRVQVSPLGTGRRARRGLPTAWRAVPVTVGIGGLFLIGGFPGILGDNTHPVAEQLVVGTVLGVVIVGPWACLVLISLLGVGLDLAASYAFYSIDGSPWSPPGLDLAVSVGGGVLAAFAMSACALPLMDAATRYDAVRYE